VGHTNIFILQRTVLILSLSKDGNNLGLSTIPSIDTRDRRRRSLEWTIAPSASWPLILRQAQDEDVGLPTFPKADFAAPSSSFNAPPSS
jgi:hypothetical protein